jgi:hypothetical protein
MLNLAVGSWGGNGRLSLANPFYCIFAHFCKIQPYTLRILWNLEIFGKSLYFRAFFSAMRTVTNYFLLNLAVADILITLFCTLNQVKKNLFLLVFHFLF